MSDNSTKVATTAYVDSTAGLTDTLEEVLAIGNNTGATKIEVNNTNSGIDFIDDAKIRLGTGNNAEIYYGTQLQVYAVSGNVVVSSNAAQAYLIGETGTYIRSDGAASKVQIDGKAGVDIQTNGTNALVIDTSQNSTFAGNVTFSSASSPILETVATSTNNSSLRLRGSLSAAPLLGYSART